MAYSNEILGQSSDAPCLHPRLILETTTAANRYLTGYYVCEQCGQHFDQPPIKQKSPPTTSPEA